MSDVVACPSDGPRTYYILITRLFKLMRKMFCFMVLHRILQKLLHYILLVVEKRTTIYYLLHFINNLVVQRDIYTKYYIP